MFIGVSLKSARLQCRSTSCSSTHEITMIISLLPTVFAVVNPVSKRALNMVPLKVCCAFTASTYQTHQAVSLLSLLLQPSWCALLADFSSTWTGLFNYTGKSCLNLSCKISLFSKDAERVPSVLINFPALSQVTPEGFKCRVSSGLLWSHGLKEMCPYIRDGTFHIFIQVELTSKWLELNQCCKWPAKI